MIDSAINWKAVAYILGGCWLIFAFMLWLLGEQLTMFLNPLPIVVKAIFGMLVYGYIGSTSGRNLEAIFVYWTLLGLWVFWWLHKTKWKLPGVIIGLTVLLHIVLSVLAFFPMMLMNGR